MPATEDSPVMVNLIPENEEKCSSQLALKAPITTAADDKFCDIFPNFWKK